MELSIFEKFWLDLSELVEKYAMPIHGTDLEEADIAIVAEQLRENFHRAIDELTVKNGIISKSKDEDLTYEELLFLNKKFITVLKRESIIQNKLPSILIDALKIL